MPAQGRGANLDTSRRVGAPSSPSVRQQAAARVTPGSVPRGVPPSEVQNYKNAQFGPRPGYRSGMNEREKPLTKYQYKVRSNPGEAGKEWRTEAKTYRPTYVKPTGGVEAPHPAPERDSERGGPFERGKRLS